MKNYGNTFNSGRESVDAGKLPIWNSTDEFYPSGCTFNTQSANTVIKAGTAVYVEKMGGEATVYNSTSAPSAGETLEVTGLLLEDVVVGSNGATGTIVTKGSILVDRIDTLSPAVITALGGRITLIHE